MAYRPQPKHLFLLGLGVTLAVTLTMAVFQSRMSRSVRLASDQVAQTVEVGRAFSALSSTIIDAETGQRGFLLTDDPSYLVPFNQALTDVDARIGQLRDLTTDSRAQTQRVITATSLIHQKFDEMKHTVDLSRSGQRAAAIALVQSNRGRDLMDQIRQVMRDGTAEVERALSAESAALSTSTGRSSIVQWILVALNATIFAALVLALDRLQRLESMVTICAWSRTIEFENEWISFEEYLWRRFHMRVSHGVSPAEEAALMAGLPEN